MRVRPKSPSLRPSKAAPEDAGRDVAEEAQAGPLRIA